MFPGRSRSWGCWVSGRGGVFGGPESGGGPWLHRLFGCEEQTAIGSQIRALAQPPVWRWVPDPEPQAPSDPLIIHLAQVQPSSTKP